MRSHLCACRRGSEGGAVGWVVLVLVVAALAFALFTIKRSGHPEQVSVRTADLSGSFDRSKAAASLEPVAEQFKIALEQGRDLAPVVNRFRQFVDRYPDFARARTLLAHSLFCAGDLEEAYDQFEQSFEINPRQPEAQLNAGSTAAQLGRLDRAQEHYSQALGLDPGNARYRLHLANIYIKQQRFDKARRMLMEALRLDSSLHQAHAALSDVFAKQNKIGLALDQIQRALEMLDEEDLLV